MSIPFDATWATAYLTALLVFVTAFYAWVTFKLQKATEKQAKIQTQALELQNRALALQSKMLNAQLLAQRFDMYWKARSPVTDDELSEVDLIPDDYMDPNTYSTKYKNDKVALRRYLSLCSIYEYLAFTYSMKKMEIPDPLGYNWTEQWAKDLANYTEFREVNDWYRSYYPEFAGLIDRLFPEAISAQQDPLRGSPPPPPRSEL